MVSLNDAIDAALKGRQPWTVGRFEVADDSPFTVYLDGSTTAVTGAPLKGMTYSVGDTGYYLKVGLQAPLCLPTA